MANMPTLGGRAREERIAAKAQSQFDVMALRDFRAVGLSDSAVHARSAARRLHCVHRAVYTFGHARPVGAAWLMANVLACGEDAVISHSTAAGLWGLVQAGGPVHVTVPARHGGLKGPDSVRVHRTRLLDPRDFGTLDGLPITSLPRTLADLAATEPEQRVARAVHEAEVLRLLDVEEVLATLERLPGRRGGPLLRRLLGTSGPAPDEGRLVELFLALCAAYGLPAPQVGVHRDGGLAHLSECDVVYEDARLIIELDGEAVHRTRKRFHEDRRRDAAFAARGYQTLRYTWDRLTRDQAAVAREIRAVLDLRKPARAA